MSYSTPEWPPWIPCEDAGIAQSKLARIYLQIQGIPETCLCPQAAVLVPFPDENLSQFGSATKTPQNPPRLYWRMTVLKIVTCLVFRRSASFHKTTQMATRSPKITYLFPDTRSELAKLKDRSLFKRFDVQLLLKKSPAARRRLTRSRPR